MVEKSAEPDVSEAVNWMTWYMEYNDATLFQAHAALEKKIQLTDGESDRDHLIPKFTVND